MKDLLRTESHRLQQIRRLTELSRAITYASSLDEVLQLTADRAAELVAAEKSLLMVANDEGLLTVRSSYGVDATLAEGIQEPMDEALIPRLAKRLGAEPHDLLGVPLVVSNAIKGVLVVIRPATTMGKEQDEWLLSALADQAAAAMEKQRLDEIGEFREQLIGIVGHDLRNPLGAILMATHLLLESESLGTEANELVRRIATSASRSARLVDHLLDLTRSRLGTGIPINRTGFEMSDVGRQVVGETELTHPDRPIRMELQGGLSGDWDRDRMYQVLSNLVGNAVQHGQARSPIDLRIEGGEAEVIIDVTNSGTPIPATILPFIFDAFRKGRAAHPSRIHGLGLGLFIARQVARAHGGSITVTSSAKDGTTFRVRLPRGAAAAQGTKPPVG